MYIWTRLDSNSLVDAFVTACTTCKVLTCNSCTAFNAMQARLNALTCNLQLEEDFQSSVPKLLASQVLYDPNIGVL